MSKEKKIVRRIEVTFPFDVEDIEHDLDKPIDEVSNEELLRVFRENCESMLHAPEYWIRTFIHYCNIRVACDDGENLVMERHFVPEDDLMTEVGNSGFRYAKMDMGRNWFVTDPNGNCLGEYASEGVARSVAESYASAAATAKKKKAETT